MPGVSISVTVRSACDGQVTTSCVDLLRAQPAEVDVDAAVRRG